MDRNLALVDALRKIAEAKGVSVAQIAIAWVAAQGDDIVPLIGARRRDRLDEALGALNVKLGGRRFRGHRAGGAEGRRGRRPLCGGADGEPGQRIAPRLRRLSSPRNSSIIRATRCGWSWCSM